MKLNNALANVNVDLDCISLETESNLHGCACSLIR